MTESFVAQSQTRPDKPELDSSTNDQPQLEKPESFGHPFSNKSETDRYSYHQERRSPWLPDIRIDGLDRKANDSSASIERDSQNRISKIHYPGENKVREFGRDAQGELNSVVTKDKTGTSRLIKENGNWFAAVDGNKLPLPGNLELSPAGDLSLALDAKTFRTEKSDGRVLIENVNASGARIASTTDGKIERICRRDGSLIEATYKDGSLAGISEASTSGKQVQWNRQGEVWTSDTKPPQHRINFSLHENGNTSYIGTDGYKHTVRTLGNEIIEGPGKGKFSFDAQGRVQSIEYPDGKTARKFEYDADSYHIKSVTQEDKVKQKITVSSRQENSNEWKMTDANGKKLGSWKGDVSIAPDGTYSVKKDSSRAEEEEEEQEEDVQPEEPDDPTEPEETDDEQEPLPAGVPERSNSLTQANPCRPETAPDDPETQPDDPETQPDDPEEQPDDPETPDDPWRIINSWEDKQDRAAGWKSYRPDGSTARERVTEDGSKAIFDKQGRLSSIQRADGSSIEALYKGSKLTQVVESKFANHVTWSLGKNGEWKSNNQPEIRRKLSFNRNGDMSFETADAKKHVINL